MAHTQLKTHKFLLCQNIPPLPSDIQCGYFEWSNEINVGQGSRETNGGQGSREANGGQDSRKTNSGPSFSGTIGGQGGAQQKASFVETMKKKPRKCGLCHEPGHTRAKCPMKNDWN